MQRIEAFIVYTALKGGAKYKKKNQIGTSLFAVIPTHLKS